MVKSRPKKCTKPAESMKNSIQKNTFFIITFKLLRYWTRKFMTEHRTSSEVKFKVP